MSYYFGPHVTKEPGTTSEMIVIARATCNAPNHELMPVMRYAFGPYPTKKEAIQKAHYQFSFIRRFIFVNCQRPN